jgi:hypothetical protein
MKRAPTRLRLTRCPQCSKRPTDRHKDFGYCGNCRTHTLIVSNGECHTFEPVIVGEGGILRCCTEPRNAWALLNPSPWDDGTTMPCMYHGFVDEHGHAHGLVYRAENSRWYAWKPTAES